MVPYGTVAILNILEDVMDTAPLQSFLLMLNQVTIKSAAVPLEVLSGTTKISAVTLPLLPRIQPMDRLRCPVGVDGANGRGQKKMGQIQRHECTE